MRGPRRDGNQGLDGMGDIRIGNAEVAVATLLGAGDQSGGRQITGGLYLLWLAYKAFRGAASRHDIEARTLDGEALSPRGYYRRGLTIQMTNPKAALAWIAIISLGLQAGGPIWVAVSIVAGTTALSVIIHCVFAIAFSTKPMVRLYGKARRWIQGTLGAFFALAGLKLLSSRT